MDDQHRKITGYRELGEAEIELMNRIKSVAIDVGELVVELRHPIPAFGIEPDQRWVAIGATELQQGFMALTRAVAKPDFF